MQLASSGPQPRSVGQSLPGRAESINILHTHCRATVNCYISCMEYFGREKGEQDEKKQLLSAIASRNSSARRASSLVANPIAIRLRNHSLRVKN